MMMTLNMCPRFGLLVLYVHDISDIMIDLLKLTNYLKLDSERGVPLVEPVFVTNLITWVYFRMYLLPYTIVYQGAYQGFTCSYALFRSFADGGDLSVSYCYEIIFIHDSISHIRDPTHMLKPPIPATIPSQTPTKPSFPRVSATIARLNVQLKLRIDDSSLHTVPRPFVWCCGCGLTVVTLVRVAQAHCYHTGRGCSGSGTRGGRSVPGDPLLGDHRNIAAR